MLIETIFWGVALSFGIALSVLTAGHALLTKRLERAALGWMLICLLLPAIGPLLYGIFGVNRIRTRARASGLAWRASQLSPAPMLGKPYVEIDRVSRSVTHMPVVAGNQLGLLHNGEQAYPAMLHTIDAAKERLFLATYLFDSDETGRKFVAALERAKGRGVDVRVLVDGVGELYSRPRISRLLAQASIPVRRFIPPRLLPPSLHINLRNHCKLLVADGRVGYTGGMNIGDRHLAQGDDDRRVIDVHCRIEGPLVNHMERVFLDLWAFVAPDDAPTAVFPHSVTAEKGARCRALVDGPNEDLHTWLMVLLGVLSSAERSIRIMTPYFLPPRELVAAIQGAALRGVTVDIVLPERNNLPFVHWAARNALDELLETGVYVYYQPPPFVHSKLLVVDSHYSLIGSANWDPRSLRLNFELGVEVYDSDFSEELTRHFDACVERSRRLYTEELRQRPLHVQVRDALAWLFSPYL